MWKFPELGLTLLLCGAAAAQMQDLTRQAGASGPLVVESVVNLIHESCVFPNDRLLLRRVAYFATNDGQDAHTYVTGFDGGIWAVSQQDFYVTKGDPNMQAYYNHIGIRFGIDWNRVQWSDLRKPLYSGLAEALFLVQSFGANVPVGIENQATWYQKMAYPNDPGMAYNFTKQAQQLDKACSSSVLDIAFIVDSSSSLSSVDFSQALRFAADVLEFFTISPTAVQVALMTFGTGFRTVFDFDQYSTKADVQSAIRSANYTPGQTDTDQALLYAAATLFTPANGARVTSARVAVLITDGQATHQADALQRAEELRNKGVTIFVIGVGDLIDRDELNGLATQPSCTHVQTLHGYQDLDSLRAEIQLLSCRAHVVLQDGTFTLPCSNTNNFRVTIKGNETITVHTSSGYVDVYGSFLNPYPNRAFSEFTVNSSALQDAIIYVKDDTRPLYLSVVSQGADRDLCPAGGNFSIVVQNKNAIRTDAKVICYENGILRDCTPLDYLMAIYVVEKPSTLGFTSRCQPPHLGYYVHPYYQDRFIYCDANGVPYIVFCPSGYWYNDVRRACQFGHVPTVPASTASSPVPQVATTPPQVVTPGNTGANPCTQEALNLGQHLFPYAPDPHKYIFCTEWPNFGVLKTCDPNHKWSQETQACIYDGPVVEPIHSHEFSTPIPAAIREICQPDRHDGDLFFYPYPGNHHWYIHCDQFGNAFVMVCPGRGVWTQASLTCTPEGLVGG